MSTQWIDWMTRIYPHACEARTFDDLDRGCQRPTARIHPGDIWKTHFRWLRLHMSAIRQSKVAWDFCEYASSMTQIVLNFNLTLRIQKHMKLPYYPSLLNESYSLDLLHVNGWLQSSQDPRPFWNFALSSTSFFGRPKEEITVEKERLIGGREKKGKLWGKSPGRCK